MLGYNSQTTTTQLREEQLPTMASHLQPSSPEATLAPSAASTIVYEKDARSVLSSQGNPESTSGRSSNSILQDGEDNNEKADVLAKIKTSQSQNGAPLDATRTREDGTEYPTGVKLGLISLALCLSVFLTALE